MPRSKTFRRSHSHRKGFVPKKRGGGDAQSSMIGVVGQYPHSAQAGAGNLIAQQPLATTTIAPPQLGGIGGLSTDAISLNKDVVGGAYLSTVAQTPKIGGKNDKRKGGSVLSEVAVPAVLLIANQTFGKKTGKKTPYLGKRYSRRRRSSRRF